MCYVCIKDFRQPLGVAGPVNPIRLMHGSTQSRIQPDRAYSDPVQSSTEFQNGTGLISILPGFHRWFIFGDLFFYAF